MRTIRQPVWLGFAGISALLISVAGGRAEEKPAAKAATAPAKAAVSETDKLQFTQKDVQAQMQELQDRMFHLARLTKESEPDNSTRLLLAVRKAREQLIIEQMTEVLRELGRRTWRRPPARPSNSGEARRIEEAADRRRSGIAASIRAAAQFASRHPRGSTRRSRARSSSKRNREPLAGLMKKAGRSAKPQAARQRQESEAANRQLTQSIADSVQVARRTLEQAAGVAGAPPANRCRRPQAAWGSGKPGDAQPEQQADATQGNWKQPATSWRKSGERVLAELDQQVKRVVIENLQEMLDRQTAVRRSRRNRSRRSWRNSARPSSDCSSLPRPSSESPRSASRRSIWSNETEFSVALPPALETLRRTCSMSPAI